MDYKASKAWHYSHSLALEIQELLHEVYEADQAVVELANKLRESSLKPALHIARSVKQELKKEKIASYHAAQSALDEVYNHLITAHDRKYIEAELFEKLSFMALTAHKELHKAIKVLERARRKEIYGAEYN